MKIFYKEREIDYEKTLGGLGQGQSVMINSSFNSTDNIRSQVHKIAKKLPGMAFSVHRTINGTSIERTT